MEFKEIKFNKNELGAWQSKLSLTDDVTMSIVASDFAYSTPRSILDDPFKYERYEIAIFKGGDFTREFFDGDHPDDVMGYVTKERILKIINQIQNG